MKPGEGVRPGRPSRGRGPRVWQEQAGAGAGTRRLSEAGAPQAVRVQRAWKRAEGSVSPTVSLLQKEVGKATTVHGIKSSL